MRTYALLSLLIFCVVGYVHACTVPVFRYALERWQPDAYEATLFSRGARPDGLFAEPATGQPKTNLSVRMDLSE